uniref:Uncharacterized protein n=1 Tax=Cacopsylla melanoneura TaxID=428564 RepID=A0A8D8WE57_9HEMI
MFNWSWFLIAMLMIFQNSGFPKSKVNVDALIETSLVGGLQRLDVEVDVVKYDAGNLEDLPLIMNGSWPAHTLISDGNPKENILEYSCFGKNGQILSGGKALSPEL